MAQALSPTGSVRVSALFDAQGGEALSGPMPPDPYGGFGGQWGCRTDWQTTYTSSLVLCGHRFYDFNSSRFLNRDPIGYDGGVNLYGYCGNNPVNGSDPTGYAQVTITGCSPADKAKVGKAIRDICQIRIPLLQNPQARKCAYYSCQQPIYVKCVSHDPNCKQGGNPDCSYASGNNSDVIHLCKDSGAFGPPGGGCGCLSKTILWEMINNCGHPPNKDSPLAPCSNQPFGIPEYPPCP